MKKKSRIYMVLTAAVCAMLLSESGMRRVSAVPLSSITSDSIREKESQVEQARQEKENLQSGLTDLQKLKKDLESKRTDLKNYVAELDSSLAEIQQNIEDLKQQIAQKEEELIRTQNELDEALERETSQQESMIGYIKYTYEAGNSQAMDMLLAANEFGDFLNKADYVEKVLSYEHMMWQDYKNTREYVELCKEQLELEKEILDQTKANAETEEQSMQDLIDQKTRDIISYETDITNKEQAIKELEAEIAAENELNASLEASIAEEKKKILAGNGTVLSYDGGMFKFPLATYTRVSDEYGWRIHPILGVEQFHNGVDLAAPAGTAIFAAYDGKVVAADYSQTMGNYVMIDHGDSLYTIYMHASALYVKTGDIVVRGETIAAVGTTGRSTGNHLHFGVRLNGEYTSPWNYLKQ